MPPPLQLTGSLRVKARLTQWALFGILAGFAVLIVVQAQALVKSPSAGASSTGVIVQAMQARLSALSNGLKDYLQNHNSDSLEVIKADGKEASRLLGELKENSRQTGSSAAAARTEKAYEDFRQAALVLLAAEQTEVKKRQSLNESNEALMSILRDQMESSVKANQLNSSGRRRAVRAAFEEAKNLSTEDFPAGELGAGRPRFRRAIVTYEELSRTRRAAQWADEARTLYDQSLARARELQQARQEKQAALENGTQKRAALDTIFKEFGAAEGRGLLRQSLKRVFAHGFLLVLLGGILLVIGMAIVIGTGRQLEHQFVGPLQEILQCVEAASTGDMSRTPDYWSRDEIGQLSQAVGRLITVLARSENLVYHLAALVEGSGEAIISHTLDGTILSWNKGAQRIYGYSAEEVKGQSITILSPHDEGAEMMRILERIKKGERVQPFETRHQARSGRSVQALVRVSAILDSTRKVIGASFCAQDLTDTNLTRLKATEGTGIS